MLATNMKVSTPIGMGIIQGAFAVMAGNEAVVNGVMVRLPIDDATRPQLAQSNCLTPHASLSGVWVFQEKELS
jgi:hypothetical protein